MTAGLATKSTQALPDMAVAISGLTKVYKASGKAPAKLALDHVDLDVPRGSVFGLLGPNGAGKSTLINILAGLVNRTGGSASVWGYDIEADWRRARLSIGVVPQELNIDPFFTPRELLELHAGLYGVPKPRRRTDEILEAVGLAEKANAYARTLSGGMRRRLLVAKAMVHNPPVLVLDEPTAGVDVELRRQLWDYVQMLNRGGTTVLLTTHYLQEAEELCDRIAIIDKGRVVANESKRDLLRRIDGKSLIVTLDRDVTDVPAELAGFDAELPEPRRLVVRYQPSRVQAGAILAAIQAAGLVVADLSTEEADLEDVFLQLTARTPMGDAPPTRSA